MEQDFWCLDILVCCYVAKQYSEIIGIFFKVSNRRRVQRVINSKITGGNTFNGDLFGIEGNHG